MDREAYRFVDWLKQAEFSVWQVLPLGPTHEDKSPYLSLSAFAGNPDLISTEMLLEDEVLSDTWLGKALRSKGDYSFDDLVDLLSSDLESNRFNLLPDAESFLKENQYWLRDYAQFMTLRRAQGNKAWWHWPLELRNRDLSAVRTVLNEHTEIYTAFVAEQYLFERQWQALKSYANACGVDLFGDIALYVAHDSADVWANRHFFALDEHGQAAAKAGVPPDMFSDTGQIWGNPVFNWPALEQSDFAWWIQRVRRQLSLVDLIRIDHFRGLQAYWSIPAEDETAVNGRWIEAPGAELLQQLRSQMGNLPLVVEDLGYITPEVDALRESFQLPCMRVIQFGFDGSDDNPHAVANIVENTVVYTGTHDNDTVVSWFDSLHPEAQAYIRDRLNLQHDESILEAMIRTTLSSSAALAILPMQDILGLGAGNRMNKPGTVEDNWTWQFHWHQVSADLALQFHQQLVATYRLPSSTSNNPIL